MKTLNTAIIFLFIITNSYAQWFFQVMPKSGCYLFSVKFIDSQTGWAVGSVGVFGAGVIFKTTNGGANWVNLPVSAPPLRCVAFADKNNGIVVGEKATILKTSDGGDT